MPYSKAWIQAMNELPEPNPEAAPPSSDPVKWVEATRFLKNRQPFTFEDRPYLHQIYRDPTPEIYIVKGRQTEISELLVNMMMYNAGRHPGTVGLYMSSTQDKAYAFSNMRLEDWALKTSPAWRQLAPKKQSHTRQIKLVNGSTMLFRSAFNQYEEARAYPVDFLYLDEIQSQDVEYIDVAKEAMSHSRHGRIWGVGTGDYEETEWWKRWHMGIRHRWDGDAWVADAGGDPRIHSYHIPQAIVPWITDEDIEAKFNAAQSRNQAIMEITGWWVEGVQKPITSKMIRACYDPALTLAGRVDRSLGPIFVGIDLGGGTQSHTIFWAMQCLDEDAPVFRLLYVSAVDDKSVEAQAARLNKLIAHFEPERGVIDEGGGTHQLQKVEDRYIGTVHRCRYTNDMDRPLNVDDLMAKNVVKANRTFAIDGIIDLINRPHKYPRGEVRRLVIPYADPKKIDWIVPHFTAIFSKLAKSASGQEYVKYDKEPDANHDVLMAATYAHIAYRVWRREREFEPAFGVSTLR